MGWRSSASVCLLLGVAFSLAAGCGHLVYSSGPYSGQVVDAETGRPVAGAAVVAIWTREMPTGPEVAEGDWDVYETLSDGNGQFAIPHRTHFTPFGWILEPKLKVYYPAYTPGYAAYYGRDVPVVDRPPRDPRDRDRPETYVTIPLRRPTTRGARIHDADLPLGMEMVRWEQVPNLMRLINEERSQLGLQPFRKPGSQP
ncbi:MAG: carboxypeptidase-like regulatory domain-containing protein [Candidatus Rokubacteria bacterium]|nr:carboxypeptidase-like regulatory domain-containing protein [Candidatus Rokubacteria bacterium]